MEFGANASAEESVMLGSQETIETLLRGDGDKSSSLQQVLKESRASISLASIDLISSNIVAKSRRSSFGGVGGGNSTLNSRSASRSSFVEEDSTTLNEVSNNDLSSSSSSLNSVSVFLSTNHFDTVTCELPSSATVQDLLAQVLSSLASTTDFPLKISDFVLLVSSDKMEFRRLEPSPNSEEKIFSSFASQLGKESSNSSGRAAEMVMEDAFIGESDEVAPSCRYNMSSDCSYAFLPPENKITPALINGSSRLRLCHLMELAVYRQACRFIRVDSNPTKPASQFHSRLFNKQRNIFIAPFVPFQGLLPYNPSRHMSLMRPIIHARIHSSLKWSKAIPISSPALESVSITSTGLSFNDEEQVYHFGLFSTKGEEAFACTTLLCFVPRIILFSRLTMPLLLAYIGYEHLQPVKLEKGKVMVYHPEVPMDVRLLKVSRCPDDTGLPSFWSGEIDFFKTGSTFIFLRNTEFILRVKVEILGGSFMITFAEQDQQWPPYMLTNETDFRFRFMQGTAAEVLQRKPEDWISLPASSSAPYVWEFPHSLSRVLTLQQEVFGVWETLGGDGGIALDDLQFALTCRLKSRLPALAQVGKLGYIMWRKSSDALWYHIILMKIFKL